nr:immunoglobulin heavy chain junction region [Mus musculus]
CARRGTVQVFVYW